MYPTRSLYFQEECTTTPGLKLTFSKTWRSSRVAMHPCLTWSTSWSYQGELMFDMVADPLMTMMMIDDHLHHRHRHHTQLGPAKEDPKRKKKRHVPSLGKRS